MNKNSSAGNSSVKKSSTAEKEPFFLKNLREDFRRLWPYVRPQRKRLIISFFALFVAAGCVLLVGNGVRMLVDDGLLAKDITILNDTILMGLGLILLLAISSGLRTYHSEICFQLTAIHLREAFYIQNLKFSPAFFQRYKVSDVLSRFSEEIGTVCSNFGVQISSNLRNLLIFFGSLALMIKTSFLLAGFVLVAIPLFLMPAIMAGRYTRRMSGIVQKHRAKIFGHVSESLHELPLVQAYNHESLDLKKKKELNTILVSMTRNVSLIKALLAFGVILILFSYMSGVIWLSGYAVSEGEISAGTVAEFIFYALLFCFTFNSLSSSYIELQKASASTKRIFEIMDATPDITSPAHPKPLPTPPQGRLECTQLTFSYEKDHDSALDGFDLQIEPGEKVALVGPSGAGKSTLFRLLLRFYDPQSGHIRFDGVNIRDCDLHDLRARFGLVSQEPAIFSTSVADNIRYGNPEASMEEIEQAAKEACASDFIKALPRGYDTLVGERGIKLSGGQKQRVAIARAILRRPAVLLLDEATSSLDVANEALIQVALERLMTGRTTLIIAHRLSTVRKCDRIIVISHGHVVAQGTHEELLAQEGLYAYYVSLQQQDDPLWDPLEEEKSRVKLEIAREAISGLA